ncbi:DUF308 domain-containing protein [Amycolatopsis cynarae]|uniref:DUF308 domain-containing protein n=1 Tax=Amycolatopsis cynarae TaxID=2995223 RepID=A0ABY7BCD0_9PSEU|nr:DUF308 domain-containing protein [Amycolatopsis sp. HUAS 11-8]WAL68288.1 DUF308 domain-containing protein [Amycolatopsis sp. HUAS 11-8]
MTSPATGNPVAGAVRPAWWVPLVLGGAWLVFSLAVFQFDRASAWALSVVTGLTFIAMALCELAYSALPSGARWWHPVLAAAFFALGLVALVWPQPTFHALIRIVAWFLLVKGGSDLVAALARPGGNGPWWLRLVLAAAAFGIAFWAAGSPAYSAAALVLWVGLSALLRGVSDILLAFELRMPSPRGL